MRSDAKASTAGSTQRQARPLGHLLGGVCAVATVLALLAAPASAAPPAISDAWVEDVVFEEATLRAEINPEGAATSFHFEYGTSVAYGGETAAGTVGSDSSKHKIATAVSGLQPDTTYHYRVVANSSQGESKGPDHTFTTYARPAQDAGCPNQAIRSGPAANLPDCRAYEMVTPVDKSGADINPRPNSVGYDLGSEQAALDGSKMAYVSPKPFGDALSNLYPGTEYIASRGADGWSSHAISPPHEHNFDIFALIFQAPGRFSAFSEDLSTGFLYDDAKPPLTTDAATGSYNNYLRNNVTETYTALTTEFLSGIENFNGMGFMGYSKDWSHTLFAAQAQLTPDAHPGSSPQLYDYHDGELELVSILPNDEAADIATAGQAGPKFNNETGETRNAISDDGSRIFWTSYVDEFAQSGKIYARIDGETTIPVSESVSAANDATYWMAAADGSQAIFSAGQDLYRFDVDGETPTLVAGGVDPERGVLGSSEDASSVYFVSTEALAPGATAGMPNLYLDVEGAKTVIATLANGGLSASNQRVTTDLSQVTPDGSHLIFNSRTSLTGYDNTSQETGEPVSEIYRYDAFGDQLICISCNPSGGRPESQELFEPHVYEGFEPLNEQTAAWLPTPRRGTYMPRMVSDDGNRIFFHSFDALVPHDTNGVQDVYEWEAPGVGSCDKSAPSYGAQNDGCIGLISTGESADPSTFIDASEGGHDVFFRTGAGIDSEDPGLQDIYDARAGGGLPHSTPPPSCVGDACQSVPAPPNDPTPASAAFRGAGDPTPAKPRRRCRGRKRQIRKNGAQGRRASRRCKRNNRRAGR